MDAVAVRGVITGNTVDEDLERLIGEGGCKEQQILKELIVRQFSRNCKRMKRPNDYFTIQCQKPYI